MMCTSVSILFFSVGQMIYVIAHNAKYILSCFTELSVQSPFTPLSRVLTIVNTVRVEDASQWLRNKSQTELWALIQNGNPQEILPYSIALTSQLNQVVCQQQLSFSSAWNYTFK